MRFSFIDAKRARYPVKTLCMVLAVSESGFHAWRRRPQSKRASDDARLVTHIKAGFKASRESYGSPRMTGELRDNGMRVGRHRVARLMRRAGICAKRPRRWKKTTDSGHSLPRAQNIVQRQWDRVATRPDELWVSDLTYIRTWHGWAYLCIILDAYS